jgi:1-deoxyxylulose-5-phosphate synthase
MDASMQYSSLGNTGLGVSRLSLGTVELGIDYGFRSSAHYKKPDAADAIRLVHRALDLGINLIDTARAYGESEEILGRALKGMRERVVLASKVVVEDLSDPKKLSRSIESSIDSSLHALQVETIDLLQIHNASPEILTNESALSTLEDAQRKGKFCFLGASCVGEQAVQEALNIPQIRTIMLPFNILDREMIPHVFPAAERQGVGIMARSVFLRGVLTGNLPTVPDELLPVKDAAAEAARECVGEAQSLSELALRFCLSFDAVSTAVMGVRSIEELESNVHDSEKGTLSSDCLKRLSRIEIQDRALVTPGTWQRLI